MNCQQCGNATHDVCGYNNAPDKEKGTYRWSLCCKCYRKDRRGRQVVRACLCADIKKEEIKFEAWLRQLPPESQERILNLP